MAQATTAARREGVTDKQLYIRRKAKLWSERSGWEGDWLDLIDYLAPYMGRFTPGEANQGAKSQRARKQLQSHARRAVKTLAAGLMGGMTSPARPWFRLTIANRKLRDNHEVKLWLQEVTDLMREVFARSNTYRALHQAYLEIGAFGTSATVLMPDFEDVIHLYNLTIGEYALATDGKGRVNTLVREFNLTVGQLVDEFGLENCSTTVKDHHARGNIDQWILVQHIIEPRRYREAGKKDARNMRFRSCYYEVGSGAGEDKLLADEGFNKFPVLAARWDVNGSDVYGTGPGHDALADIKEANFFKSRRAMAIDYQTNPPLQVPGVLRTAGVNRFPGGTTYVDSTGPETAIRSMFEVRLDLQHLDASMQETLQLIREHFYEDLFLMLANDTRSGTTATEIAERHEEKLLMLGPVLERLHNEKIDPLIDGTFEELEKAGLLPEIPQALQGQDIVVQYISTLAQAQRAVGLAAHDRLIATVGAVAQATADPSVWDKVNTDELIDEYAEGLGVPATVLRSDDEVAEIRAGRAQQQQAAQTAAMAEQVAGAAKTASEIDTEGAQDVMGMFTSGFGAPGSPSTPGAVQ
jgi:hypothetical protein